MKIKNFEQLATTTKRSDALSILDAGLSAIDTKKAIENSVHIEEGILQVAGHAYTRAQFERVRIVAVGKCSVKSAEALEEILGDMLTDGIVLDVISGTSRTGKITFYVGTHPLPTEANVDATTKLLTFLDTSTEHDLIIAVISGGGSALLSQPPTGLTIQEEATLGASLMGKGAAIEEMNTIRKHLSPALGGGIAQRAYPATVASLIFSDVPGDDISFIASGPTVLDTTTVSDARALLTLYAIEHVSEFLIETPKEKKIFERVTNTVVVSNSIALTVMQKKAVALGYTPEIITSTLTGEAQTVAGDILERLHTTNEKTVLLYGGETTVVSGMTHGVGGRNQEVALAGLLHVAEDEVLIACASDGHDNTDAAGAVCDVQVKNTAQERGISIPEHLALHDSFLFFEKVAGHIMTGNTESNVSDLIIALK